eukprot:8452175-Pyramimonas_sp.AAC.1
MQGAMLARSGRGSLGSCRGSSWATLLGALATAHPCQASRGPTRTGKLSGPQATATRGVLLPRRPKR